MRRKNSMYPADWIRIAKKDIERAENLLGMKDTSAAGFFLQQGVEKFLKAFLLGKGWKLERIHDLEALLNLALDHDPTLETFRGACQKISGYYLIERYPLILETGLTEEDIRSSLLEIKELIEKIQKTYR